MKFKDGNWLTKEGFEITNPMTVRNYSFENSELKIKAPYTQINHRGDTLQGPLFTVKLSSPAEDIIRVRFYHFKGQIETDPAFEIENLEGAEIEYIDQEDTLNFKSGNLEAKINKSDFSLEFFDKNRKLTASEHRKMGYVKSESDINYVKEELNLAVGEKIYGLGERFTEFVKNGQVVDIWNKDGGSSSEQAYKNIPFYLSSKGYGVFVNHPEKVSFEVGSETVNKVQFSVEGEYLDYYIIGGSSLKDVLKNYTDLLGKPALPPAWSFGLWLTTSFTTDYNEETVNKFVDGMAERDLPLSVFHFDCFWMEEYHWSNFLWDKNAFPEPEAMLERLKAKGLKISVWINPYIAQESELFDEGMEKGYFIKNEDDTVWQWDKWQPGMAIVDFTNPEACKWYQEKLKRLIEMGVDTFKTDFGERIPVEGVKYDDGSEPKKMHNYYSYLYNKEVFALLEEELGKDKAVVFARSATAGGQKFPVHWGGDCNSTYNAMAESLRAGLSLSSSGFAFWSHDIGGFESTATPDVYKRWLAFGLLSSHSRLHGSSSYRVPWLFDEESVAVLRHFSHLKYKLMPYIFSKAVEAHQTGLPVMRSMTLEYNGSFDTADLDRQYFLGDSLLVAPVLNENSTTNFYLPQGKWVDYLTKENYAGGSWYEENYDYFSLPLLVKENTLIPIGTVNDHPDYDYSQNLELELYNLTAGGAAEARIYNQKAELQSEIKAVNQNKKISFTVKGKNIETDIILYGDYEIDSLEEAELREVEAGVKISPINCLKDVIINIK